MLARIVICGFPRQKAKKWSQNTVCNVMISNLIQKIESGSATVTVIVVNCENMKISNGNSIINDEKIVLELRSRYR